MPITGSLTIPRADITDAFYYGSTQRNFIGTRIFRPLRVMKNSGKIPVVPLEALFNLPASAARVSGGRYSRINWTPSEDSYSTVEYGLEVPLDDRQRALYADLFDFEVFHGVMVYNELRRLQEKRIRDIMHTTGSWSGGTNTSAGTAAWSSASSATPIADVNNAKIQINNKCGQTKFGLQISWASWIYASLTTQIRGALQYTQMPSGLIPLDALCNAFQVDEILIGDEPYNSADTGQTASLTKIWPTTQAFVYALPYTNSPQEPCIGRTFFYNEDGADQEITAEEYVEPQVRGTVFRVRHETDENLWSTAFGHLITGI